MSRQAKLALRYDVADVVRRRGEIQEFLDGNGVTGRTEYIVHLVIEEILSNCIRHGRPDRGEARIDLTLEAGPSAVTVTVEDDGIPFDPTAARVADPPGK